MYRGWVLDVRLDLTNDHVIQGMSQMMRSVVDRLGGWICQVANKTLNEYSVWPRKTVDLDLRACRLFMFLVGVRAMLRPQKRVVMNSLVLGSQREHSSSD